MLTVKALKRARMVALISEKENFNIQKKKNRDKERYYIMINESGPHEDI